MFDKKEKMKVYIDGMKCKHCSERVKSSLSKINNVKKVDVNLESKYAIITYVKSIDEDQIKQIINSLDYEFIKIEK